jgi:hypothetical protein
MTPDWSMLRSLVCEVAEEAFASALSSSAIGGLGYMPGAEEAKDRQGTVRNPRSPPWVPRLQE